MSQCTKVSLLQPNEKSRGDVSGWLKVRGYMIASIGALMTGSALVLLSHVGWQGVTNVDVASSGIHLAGRASGDVPWLQILGGPSPPPQQRHWINRFCTALNHEPHCSHIRSWEGHVTLVLDGKRIEGVHMKTTGHVSKLFPKQQFGVTLPTPLSIMGMVPSQNWRLAMSFIDSTFQRNALAFDIYRKLGGWATETRYVNLDWQGVDFGLYYFVQVIEREPGRVELPEAFPDHPAKSGYLLAIDWPKPHVVVVNSSLTNTNFGFKYPDDPSPGQSMFVEQVVSKVDECAASKTCKNLEDFMDYESWARFFILEEIAKDVDGYAFSDYVQIQGGKLFHAAPWDFDLAFGFACIPQYYKNGLTGENFADLSKQFQGWNVENIRDSALSSGPHGLPVERIVSFGRNKRQMFTNIWSHKSFRAFFAKAWKAARRGPLSDDGLQGLIKTRSAELAQSASRDISIWKDADRCAVFVQCCHPDDTQSFATAETHLLEFTLGRARWIDAHVDGY